jgi:ABC-type multidrug transport system ATPase subunit
VDTETEADIRQALNDLMENRTTFIIAHRIQSVMKADLILVLDQGQSSRRAHENCAQEDGMYRKIYDMQTRVDEELARRACICREVHVRCQADMLVKRFREKSRRHHLELLQPEKLESLIKAMENSQWQIFTN